MFDILEDYQPPCTYARHRLLTPGPTPLYPPALHAMMGSDIHHRTEDFRNIYRATLADLKEVMGTSNDVLMLVASGTGAMESAVSNLFSRGDKVIVCSAGKFGERWVEMAKAFGLDATVLKAEYGDTVKPEQVEAALAANPGVTRRVRAGLRDLDRRRARHPRHGTGDRQDRRHLRGGRDHRSGHHALDIDGWGLDVVVGGSQKAFMIPPGLGLPVGQPQGLEARRDRQSAALLLRPEEGEEERGDGRVELDAEHVADHRPERGAQVHQVGGHGQAGGERATAGARPRARRPWNWASSCSRPARRAPR